MKYMYTTTPDKNCHEVEDGIYGRPCHTTEEPKLKKLGWEYHAGRLREKARNEVREEAANEEAQAENEEINARQELEQMYKDQFGKSPHHKMKDETILEKLKEATGDDQG